MNVSAVRGLVDALAAEGHIYSTTDDDHFAVCAL